MATHRGSLGLLVPLGLAAAGVVLFLETGPSLGAKRDFIMKFAPIDLRLSKREGFPVGVLTAWAAMESNYASSKLAKKGNNLFGIKAGPIWIKSGRAFDAYPTHEYQGTGKEISIVSNFRHYPDWTASAEDVIKEMQTDFRKGGALLALRRHDIGGFLRGIAASGYSTASNYGQRIENFMREIARIG